MNSTIIYANAIFTAAKKEEVKPFKFSSNTVPDGFSESAARLWFVFWELYGKGNWHKKALIKEAYGTGAGTEEFVEWWEKKMLNPNPLAKIKPPEKQMGMVVSIWKYFANKRGVVPFEKGHTYNQEAKDMFKTAYTRRREALVGVAKKVLNGLVKEGVIFKKSVKKEKLDDINFSKKHFVIDSYIAFQTKDGVFPSKTISDVLRKCHFIDTVKDEPKFNSLKHKGSSIHLVKDKKDVYIFISVRLTDVEAMYFTNKKDTTDIRDITTRLFKKVKKYMKTEAFKKTELKAMLLAAKEKEIPAGEVSEEKDPQEQPQQGKKQILFVEDELNTTEQKLLEDLEKEFSEMESGELFNTYNMNFIRDVGDPTYQYFLTKQLIEECVERELKIPTAWSRIVTDPQKYLIDYEEEF